MEHRGGRPARSSREGGKVHTAMYDYRIRELLSELIEVLRAADAAKRQAILQDNPIAAWLLAELREEAL